MVDQRQSQDKKMYLESIDEGRRGDLCGEERIGSLEWRVQKKLRKWNETVK